MEKKLKSFKELKAEIRQEFYQEFVVLDRAAVADYWLQKMDELNRLSSKFLLETLPEEKIIHSYMETQSDGHSKEYCEGWNDYRLVLIDKLK